MNSAAPWTRRIRPLFTLYVPVTPFVLFALFPLYFMLVTSFKKNAELYDVNAVPFLIGRGVTLGHYELLSKETRFWSWFLNSLMVSLAATVISVVLGVLAAYPLARLKFPGANSFGVAIFVTYLVPPSLLFLPLSTVVARLGLSDSLWALVVTYPTFLVPFCTWLLMGYFRTVPKEIEECAMLDGCNRLQTVVRILLPGAGPGVICAADPVPAPAGVRLAGRAEDDDRRGLFRADPRRHLLLGRVDGGGVHRLAPPRGPLAVSPWLTPLRGLGGA